MSADLGDTTLLPSLAIVVSKQMESHELCLFSMMLESFQQFPLQNLLEFFLSLYFTVARISSGVTTSCGKKKSLVNNSHNTIPNAKTSDSGPYCGLNPKKKKNLWYTPMLMFQHWFFLLLCSLSCCYA